MRDTPGDEISSGFTVKLSQSPPCPQVRDLCPWLSHSILLKSRWDVRGPLLEAGQRNVL